MGEFYIQAMFEKNILGWNDLFVKNLLESENL